MPLWLAPGLASVFADRSQFAERALLITKPQTARADNVYGYLLPDSSYTYLDRIGEFLNYIIKK